MSSTEHTIVKALLESAHIKEEIAQASVGVIAAIASAATASLRTGGKIILCGNGGSAADAQHLAAELVGRFQRNRRALPALALTANTSTVTALGNDFGFETIFSRQIEALAAKGDVVIGISTSGDSANVIDAIRAAREKGAVTVAFTGAQGGKLAGMAEITFKAPSESTPRVQEAHITVGHIICDIIESELAGPESRAPQP